MYFFRQTSKQTLLLWSLFLSLSLLCVQGGNLHVHNLDDGHLTNAHFTHDTSHHDLDEHITSELNLSSDGVLKNLNNHNFTIAFLVFFFTLTALLSSLLLTRHYRDNKPIFYEHHLLSPPLRAPPLL